MKKFFLLLLGFILIFSAMPLTVIADDEGGGEEAEEAVSTAELDNLLFEITDVYTTSILDSEQIDDKYLVFRVKITNKDDKQRIIARNDFAVKSTNGVNYKPKILLKNKCFKMYELIKPEESIERLVIFEVEKQLKQFLLAITLSESLCSDFVYFEYNL